MHLHRRIYRFCPPIYPDHRIQLQIYKRFSIEAFFWIVVTAGPESNVVNESMFWVFARIRRLSSGRLQTRFDVPRRPRWPQAVQSSYR